MQMISQANPKTKISMTMIRNIWVGETFPRTAPNEIMTAAAAKSALIKSVICKPTFVEKSPFSTAAQNPEISIAH